MKSRPWLLILISVGAIVLAGVVIQFLAKGLIFYIREGSMPPSISLWEEVAARLQAALFLVAGAIGLLAMKRWGVILFWLSALVLSNYWLRVTDYGAVAICLLEHLPLLIIPLFYWKRLTWKA
jgi:hypothetical protein